MKKLSMFVVAAILAALGVAARPGGAAPPAAALARCDGGASGTTRLHGLAAGAGMVAVDGRAISVMTAGATTEVVPPDGLRGVVRHVSSRPGVGTVYVRDRRGGDVVVAVTRGRVRRYATAGEALQPSLSGGGDLVWAQGSGLRLVRSGARSPKMIAGPQPGGTTFSPLFVSPGAIVAAVAAPPTTSVPEDEYLSDLWRYDLRTSRWRRMTRFAGGADRWTIVRTPFIAADGSVEFVRVDGRASADRPPRYELWSVRGRTVHRLRVLPDERYLAGFDGDAPLWNVREGATGAWIIQRERSDGSFERVGCGAVAVDPLDRPDPDRRPGTRWASAASGGSATTTGSDVTSPATDAIVIGDFSSPGAADAAVATIESAFGSTATIVDAKTEPAIVRPGVWAVLVPLAPGADSEAELARFRVDVPGFAGWSWIVSV